MTNPEATMRPLLEATGPDWHPDCAAPERNRHAVQTLSTVEVRRPIHTGPIEAWKIYAKQLRTG